MEPATRHVHVPLPITHLHQRSGVYTRLIQNLVMGPHPRWRTPTSKRNHSRCATTLTPETHRIRWVNFVMRRVKLTYQLTCAVCLSELRYCSVTHASHQLKHLMQCLTNSRVATRNRIRRVFSLMWEVQGGGDFGPLILDPPLSSSSLDGTN